MYYCNALLLAALTADSLWPSPRCLCAVQLIILMAPNRYGLSFSGALDYNGNLPEPVLINVRVHLPINLNEEIVLWCNNATDRMSFRYYIRGAFVSSSAPPRPNAPSWPLGIIIMYQIVILCSHATKFCTFSDLYSCLRYVKSTDRCTVTKYSTASTRDARTSNNDILNC